MDAVIRRFPVVLVTIYCLRSMILGPQLVDIGVLAVLGALYAYCEFKTEQKVISSMQKDLNDMKTRQVSYEKIMSDLSTHVTGLKMGMNVRNNSPQKF